MLLDKSSGIACQHFSESHCAIQRVRLCQMRRQTGGQFGNLMQTVKTAIEVWTNWLMRSFSYSRDISHILILSHSHFLCKVFSTKLFKSHQLLQFHVFMKETETHASVHYSWSDPMSSLSDFLVNIYFPFCVPYGSVPDLTIMPGYYTLEPINMLHSLRKGMSQSIHFPPFLFSFFSVSFPYIQ